MRHGLTLGEMGRWFVQHFDLDVDYRVIEMRGWSPTKARLRLAARTCLDQSQPERRQSQHGPRLRRHRDARGDDAQRGQGHDPPAWSCSVRPTSSRAGSWRKCSALLRNGSTAASSAISPSSLPSISTPASSCTAFSSMPKGRSTITRHSGRGGCRRSPSRRSANLRADYGLWRDFPYEYVFDKLAIDVINGSPSLREWVDDSAAEAVDLETITQPDEQSWAEERQPHLLY